MDSIYVETSIVSHACARSSGNPHVAYMQEMSRNWWLLERERFDLYTSQIVIDEASRGDPKAAMARLSLLSGIPLIPISEEVSSVAKELIVQHLIPPKGRLDALHVAAAAVGGVQFLLTFNCRHIANAHSLPKIYETLENLGYPGLLIYTPAEFLGEQSHEDEPDT